MPGLTDKVVWWHAILSGMGLFRLQIAMCDGEGEYQLPKESSRNNFYFQAAEQVDS